MKSKQRQEHARRKQDAIDLLYTSCATALPYMERLFQKSRVPSPDYFEIPKVILLLEEALNEARHYVTTISQRKRVLLIAAELPEVKPPHTRSDDDNLDERGKDRMHPRNPANGGENEKT